MYKVFFYDRMISVIPSGKITLNKPYKNVVQIRNKKELKNCFSNFVEEHQNDVVLECEEPSKLMNKWFPEIVTPIDAAGGVVLRDDKMLFIYRNEKWDLPKGKIDKGENASTAALREVKEECGIKKHTIEKELPTTYHLFQSPYEDTFGKWFLKKTYWFEMKYKGKNDGKPQREENITELRWIEKKDLDWVLDKTYSSLVPLLHFYLD